jgi:hypothetical protein
MSAQANSVTPAQAEAAVVEVKKQRRREWHERGALVRAMVETWESDHARQFAKASEAVKFEARGIIRDKAERAVSRGLENVKPVLLSSELNARMQAAISQVRRQRHGPVDHFGAAEIAAQMAKIAEELGWVAGMELGE